MPVEFEHGHGLGNGNGKDHDDDHDQPDDHPDDHPLHDIEDDIEDHIPKKKTPVWVWVIVGLISAVVLVAFSALVYRFVIAKNSRPTYERIEGWSSDEGPK
jgi:ABC-type Zn2+ transport system substrate-binding protein/surface adhesin